MIGSRTSMNNMHNDRDHSNTDYDYGNAHQTNQNDDKNPGTTRTTCTNNAADNTNSQRNVAIANHNTTHKNRRTTR